MCCTRSVESLYFVDTGDSNFAIVKGKDVIPEADRIALCFKNNSIRSMVARYCHQSSNLVILESVSCYIS